MKRRIRKIAKIKNSCNLFLGGRGAPPNSDNLYLTIYPSNFIDGEISQEVNDVE